MIQIELLYFVLVHYSYSEDLDTYVTILIQKYSLIVNSYCPKYPSCFSSS